MKGSHYKQLRACGLNCLDWIEDSERVAWQKFCAEQFLAFGFSDSLVLKCLEQATGDKTVKDGKIVKVKA